MERIASALAGARVAADAEALPAAAGPPRCADAELSIPTDVANRYFQGTENVSLAIARRRIKTKGNIEKALAAREIDLRVVSDSRPPPRRWEYAFGASASRYPSHHIPIRWSVNR